MISRFLFELVSMKDEISFFKKKRRLSNKVLFARAFFRRIYLDNSSNFPGKYNESNFPRKYESKSSVAIKEESRIDVDLINKID